MPVAIPISCEHRDEVLGGDVAGRARPGPGSRRARRSSTRTSAQPASSAASTLARPWPRVLWKWAVSSAPAPRRTPARRSSRPAPGWPCPSCRRSRSPARPRPTSRLAISNTRSRVDVALVGTAEGDAITASARRPSPARAAITRSSAAQRLLDRAVDVGAVVRLAGRQEAVDLVEALALLERVLEARARWGSAPSRDTPSGTSTRSSTSAASASCGITSARTKLVTSRRRTPVRAEQVDQPRPCRRWR